jgi:opacity protein-like surface antigen
MNQQLRISLVILLVAAGFAGSANAQFQANIGLSQEDVRLSGADQPSLQRYAALALMPSLTYARTHDMPVLAEGLQDLQYIGAGLAYGSELEKIGIQVMYMYFITAQLALGGDLTYFFPDNFDGFGVDTKVNWIAFNILARYILYQTALLHAYGMGGLNLTAVRVKAEFAGQSETNSDSELGVALGGGLAYALAFAALYVELSYVLGNADQLVVAAGLRFPLGQQ